MKVKQKQILKLYFLLAVFFSLSGKGYAQIKGFYDQVASMEYKQWKFKPKDFYYTFYTNKWGVPKIGLGVHDKGPYPFPDNYVNQKWRQMQGLRIKAKKQSLYIKEYTDSIARSWTGIGVRALSEYLDKTNKSIYNKIHRKEREFYSSEIVKITEMLPDNFAESILKEHDRIQENFLIIEKSFVSNMDKIKSGNLQLEKLKQLQRIGLSLIVMKDCEDKIKGIQKEDKNEEEVQGDEPWYDMNF